MNNIATMSAAIALLLFANEAYAFSSPTTSTVISNRHGQFFVRASKSKTLYDQNGNPSGVAVVSDNFESDFDSYDDEGADDFVVPDGVTWTINQIDVTGVYFDGQGAADSENVFFYKNKKNKPGKLVAEIDNVVGRDRNGSFAIKFPKSVSLKSGTYWVSVQANMDFEITGEWAWAINSAQSGQPAMWQNPGGGFGFCPTWTPIQSCFSNGPDFMFALKGSASSK
ncbi:MAG: hypothetical protein WDM89_19845 [Rhizomicrobium sp.]